jgi:hypothetical protein
MKMVENTADRLVLENRPARLGVGLALGFAFLVAASLGLAFNPSVAMSVLVLSVSLLLLLPFFLAGNERTRLVLDLTEGTFHFERKTLRGWVSVKHPLEDLHCAEIEKQTDREGTLYRPVVSFTAQANVDQIPLVRTYTAARQAQQAVDFVNRWLERRRPYSRRAG